MSTFEEPMKLITEECFDFDLPLSPKAAESSDTNEDEDDIFFGPMGHKEKCLSVVIEEEAAIKNVRPLSPLSAKEHAEIFKEAHTIAYMLKKTAAKEENGGVSPPGRKGSDTVTIERTQSRLSPENVSLSAVKRKFEDFNVEDDEENCDIDNSKKSRPEEPIFSLNDTFEKCDKPTSALKESHVKNQTKPLQNCQSSGQKRLKLASPKRRSSGLKRPGNASENVDNTASLLQPPRKRFALTSPVDDSKSVSKRRSMEKTSLQHEENKVEQEPVRRSIMKPGSSLPAPRSMLKQPGTNSSLQKPSALKQPVASGMPRLNGPNAAKSGLQAPSQLKRPMSKLQLVKPNAGTLKPNAVTLQRKAVQSAGKVPGPIKATASVQSMAAPNASVPKTRPASAMKPMKAVHPPTTPSEEIKAPPPVKRGRPMPVLPEAPSTPGRLPSDSGASSQGTPVMTRSARRRSCLPTPRRSVGSSTFRSSASSISSIDSLASPAVHRSFRDQSPTSMLSKRAPVQRTPIGGHRESKKLSAWSPVRRPKPMNLEEQAMQCTKRNAPRFAIDEQF